MHEVITEIRSQGSGHEFRVIGEGVSELIIFDTTQLLEGVKDMVVEATTVVGMSGFRREPDNGEFRQDVENHVISPGVVLQLAFEGEECVGFCASKKMYVEGEKVLYIGGMHVMEQSQNKGIGTGFVRRLIESHEGVSLVAARTQNPSMFEVIHKVSKRVMPNLNDKDDALGLVVSKLATIMGMRGIDLETQIEKGTYGRSLYGGGFVPKSGNEGVNGLFEGKLDVANGDSMLVVGRV